MNLRWWVYNVVFFYAVAIFRYADFKFHLKEVGSKINIILVTSI